MPEHYKVVYDAVGVRLAPSTTAASLTRRLKGDVLNVLEIASVDGAAWGRVEVTLMEGRRTGWMLLRHPDLGELLRPLIRVHGPGGSSV